MFMEIDLNKFSTELQKKIKAAFESNKNIDEQEARQLGLSAEETEAINKKLSEGLSNNANITVGDSIEIRQKDNNFTYTLELKNPKNTEGVLEWSNKNGHDSLAKIREVYPDAHTPYLKNGVVTILDKNGKPVLDKNGNSVQTDFIQKSKIYTEELAELLVLRHKANPLERMMHQAEIQQKLDELNKEYNPDLDYATIMQSVAFEQMNKKEQTEALLKFSGEKFYKAIENKDYASAKEYLLQGLGLAFQKMDMAGIGNTNISIEGFKDFLKHWSGLDAICEKMDEIVNDNSSDLTSAEKIWEFTKGVGDAVDHFIGTQGVAFIGTLSIAGQAAAAGGMGEIWAIATQAYFGFEGIGSIAEGGHLLGNAQTAEEFRQSGDMMGTGAIMLHGAVKSFNHALTGKLQAGLAVGQALKEIRRSKTIEELKEIQDNLPDLPYTAQEKQVLMMECLKQSNKIVSEGVNKGVNKGANEGVNQEVVPSPQPYPEGRESTEPKGEAKEESLTTDPSPTRGEGDRLTQITEPTTSPVRSEVSADTEISAVPVNGLTESGLSPEVVITNTPEGKIRYAKSQGLQECSITPQEAEAIYKKYGFTDADIEEIRKGNPDADKWIHTYEIFSEVESDANLNNMTVKEIKENIIDMASEKQADQLLFLFINENNLKWAQENLKSPDRISALKDLFQYLESLEDSTKKFPELYKLAKKVQDLTGEPFNRMMKEACLVWDENRWPLFTPERIKAGKSIADALGRDFSFDDVIFTENPEKITPEFLAEYRAAKEQLEELNIEFGSEYDDPVVYLNDVKQGIEMIKKEGLDFSWYQGKEGKTKVRASYLKRITCNPDILHNIKLFFDMCSDKAKEDYSYEITEIAFNEGAKNPQGVGKILSMLAKYGSKSSDFKPDIFLHRISEYCGKENINWQGIADLFEAYIENNCIEWFGHSETGMLVANGDYSGAIKLLKELKTFFDGQEADAVGEGTLVENRFGSFMANDWRKLIRNGDIDFNKAKERVQQLKDKNLMDDTRDYATFERILSSDDNSIVEKYETVVKKGIRQNSHTKDYISNPDVSAEEFKKNLELREQLLCIDEGIEMYDSIEEPLVDANSLLTNRQLTDLFAKIGDKLSAADKLWLMNAFSKTSRGGGQYATFHTQALEVIERMLKEDFDAEDFSSIMRALNSMSFSGMGYSFVDKLVFNEETRLPRHAASQILRTAQTPHQASFAEWLCFNKELDFPREYIAEIVENIREENNGFIAKLCKDPDCPKKLIADIARFTTKSRLEFAERLYAEKDFPRKYIAGILARIKNNQYDGYNIELAETLCFDKELNFPKNHIADILYYTKDSRSMFYE